MSSRKDKPIVKESRVTYEDYAKLPEDGRRYEIADGVLELMSPAPTPKHQSVSTELLHCLLGTCKSEFILFVAPIDLILADHEVRQPDLVMIHRDRRDIITKRGIEGAPDLVVEILFPSSSKRDRHSKRLSYAKYGVPEYWIVDPGNEALEQYILAGDRYELDRIYENGETVQSDRLPCVSFVLHSILEAAADLPG